MKSYRNLKLKVLPLILYNNYSHSIQIKFNSLRLKKKNLRKDLKAVNLRTKATAMREDV